MGSPNIDMLVPAIVAFKPGIRLEEIQDFINKEFDGYDLWIGNDNFLHAKYEILRILEKGEPISKRYLENLCKQLINVYKEDDKYRDILKKDLSNLAKKSLFGLEYNSSDINTKTYGWFYGLWDKMPIEWIKKGNGYYIKNVHEIHSNRGLVALELAKYCLENGYKCVFCYDGGLFAEVLKLDKEVCSRIVKAVAWYNLRGMRVLDAIREHILFGLGKVF